VFRYQQTGKTADALKDITDPRELYSEIGFYSKQTQWAAANSNEYNSKTSPPNIDRLNIQSTGDIRSNAVNHHRMKAKRFELLVDCNETDFSKDLKGTNRPYGDAGSDESSLFSGDAHIRATRRIVIKAGTEIRLEVGRSTVIISDDGILMAARKTHADIPNDMDSMLNILPRNGITISGQQFRVAAVYNWGLSERMGASIQGTAGITRVTGKDIKLSTITGYGYIALFIAQTAAFATNLASMSIGIQDSDDVQSSGIPSYVGMGVRVAGMITNVMCSLVNPGNTSDDDTDSLLFTVVTLILQMVPTVLMIIEASYIEPEDKNAKDALAIAGVVVEWGCILPILVYICYDSTGPYMVFNTWQHFSNNGALYMGGAGIKAITQDKTITNSPAAGFEKVEEKGDGNWKKLLDFAKKHWWQLGLGILAGGAAVEGGIFTLKRGEQVEGDEDSILKALNEL
jgi:hypothetical protein